LFRAVREWPLWIAVAAILSLFFVPRVVRLGTTAVEPQPPDPGSEARATIDRARGGDFPGAAALMRAGIRPEFRREAASLLAEYGLVRDAVARFRELYDETRDAELALDLAPALARLAAADPASRHALLDEGAARISDYLRVAAADRRVKGLLAQARLFQESGRDEELATLLAAELAETRNPQQRGLLHLERGRAFMRLGRNREAMSSCDEAEKLLTEPFDRGLAGVHLAMLFARASNPECLEVANRLTVADSPAAPLALLVAGVHELKGRPDVALEALRNGLSRIRRPRMIDEGSFDFPWVYGALREAADRETGADRLARFALVWAEIGRLHPVSTRVGLDHAAILLRARRYGEAADRFLAAGAVREAADACAEGGLHLRAAALYGRSPDPAGLFHRAMSLKKAGDAAGAGSGFEEYLAKAGPAGTYSGVALVEKAELQAPEEALKTYDRVLKAREVSTSPSRDDWATALLGRGRTLLKLSRTAEARKVLTEYLERYAEGRVPAPASIEAAWLLVSVAIEERQWKAGLARIAELESLASKVAESDRAAYARLLREARFVEGDLHFNLEDYASASKAYEEAVRRYQGAEDRLWGLIGRARSLARLERKEEARRDYASARSILDDRTPAREYWEIALESLAKEVQ
jgi:tetratricopeptide (TPR) repeat protein